MKCLVGALERTIWGQCSTCCPQPATVYRCQMALMWTDICCPHAISCERTWGPAALQGSWGPSTEASGWPADQRLPLQLESMLTAAHHSCLIASPNLLISCLHWVTCCLTPWLSSIFRVCGILLPTHMAPWISHAAPTSIPDAWKVSSPLQWFMFQDESLLQSCGDYCEETLVLVLSLAPVFSRHTGTGNTSIDCSVRIDIVYQQMFTMIQCIVHHE